MGEDLRQTYPGGSQRKLSLPSEWVTPQLFGNRDICWLLLLQILRICDNAVDIDLGDPQPGINSKGSEDSKAWRLVTAREMELTEVVSKDEG